MVRTDSSFIERLLHNAINMAQVSRRKAVTSWNCPTQAKVRLEWATRPTGDPDMDPYACYREAWHLLREPDGLIFG